MGRFVLLWAFIALSVPAQAAQARILKVLPHLMDLQGRHALAPSLYERDAYQAELRKHPEKVSGIRYDVHWRGGPEGHSLKLRMYLRTATHGFGDPIVIETVTGKPGIRAGGWSGLTLNGEAYRSAGEVQAWRVVLLDGETELAEQRSFLW